MRPVRDHDARVTEVRSSLSSGSESAAHATVWPEVIALGSAVLVTIAAYTAVRQYSELSLEMARGAGALILAALVLVHFVLRPRAVRAVAEVARPETTEITTDLMLASRTAVATAQSAAPVPTVVIAPPPRSAAVSPSYVPPPTLAAPAMSSPVAASYVPPPLVRAVAPAPVVHDVGFDRLQTLVAELARTTPGPKAQTPDPDRPTTTAEQALRRDHAESLERSHTAQAAVLSRAARIMQGDVAVHASAAAGLAADLSDALAADRMSVFLEPIQQIEMDRARHYEISVRFKSAEGAELPHEALLAAAREAGLIARVDAAVLPRAARIAQHFQLRGRDTDIIARVHGVSLPNADFRAEVTAAAIAAEGGALVLSFAQSDVLDFRRVHWQILSTLSEMGLRFAIESVTHLDMDFDALRRHGFSFAKLDADVLLHGLPMADGLLSSAEVCAHFSKLGLSLIVGHIDDEAALARILGFGVLFGQGALFGGRRAVRPDVFAAATVAAA
jgi:EAL domain-containing protein (putative c-di-GMP-specific phosphodiesterase class I)